MTPDLRQGLKQSLDKIEKLLLSLVIAEDENCAVLILLGNSGQDVLGAMHNN
jgi:hypothetical protein